MLVLSKTHDVKQNGDIQEWDLLVTPQPKGNNGWDKAINPLLYF